MINILMHCFFLYIIDNDHGSNIDWFKYIDHGSNNDY